MTPQPLLRPAPPPRTTFKRVLVAAGLLAVCMISLSHLFTTRSEWNGVSGNTLRSLAESESDQATTTLTLREFYKQRSLQQNDDQQKVVDMMKHAWSAYDKYGQHLDMLDVVHQKGATFMGHDMAFSLVDSLDTLFVMGLHDEFDTASGWMKTHLKERMLQSGSLSFFETTIRSLGGLLSAYYLSGEAHILELANVLGKALSKAFTSDSPIPRHSIDLKNDQGYGSPCLSEASSFQLEFSYLANVTGTAMYLGYVQGVNGFIANMTRSLYSDGLVPLHPEWSYEQLSIDDKSFGASGDSHFEYLLKQWLFTGKKDEAMKQRYLQAVEGMKANLVGYSQPSNLTFLGTLKPNGDLERRMEHLTCFAPGMLALGAYHGLPQWHLELAKELLETCVQMYMRSKTKLAPEAVHFRDISESPTQKHEIYVGDSEDYNVQRPETVESLMVLYRVTKDTKYRDYGRLIVDAFETYAKVAGGGYRDTKNVFYGPIETNGNTMETFFLAKTLKYLYLLFSDDDILSLDEIVFNTEAHPLPVLRE